MPLSSRFLYRAAVGVNWAVALAWTARALYWLGGLRRLPNLLASPSPAQPSADTPTLSVIVPARNEEAAIGPCLRSLLQSTAVRLEILSVDDRSTDRTGERMEEEAALAAALGKQLRVLRIRRLPGGWMGKTHAMAHAAERASGDWLLFTDADVLFHPEALARALQYAERETADHLVLLPTPVTATFGERLLMTCLLAVSIWGPPLWKVADPAAERAAIGVGAFNLVRRSAFAAVGGWSSLRMEVIEDLGMGYLLKRAGFRARVATGPGLVRIRWGVGARGMIGNMRKNAFAALRYRPGKAVAVVLGLGVLCLFPFAALAGPRALRRPTHLTLAALLTLYARFRRETGAAPGYVFTFPMGAGLLLWALVSSTAVTLRKGGVVWRGTFYPLELLRKHMVSLA